MYLGGLAVGAVEWIQLSQDNDQLQAVINATCSFTISTTNKQIT
jgi:hypothetical protein